MNQLLPNSIHDVLNPGTVTKPLYSTCVNNKTLSSVDTVTQ